MSRLEALTGEAATLESQGRNADAETLLLQGIADMPGSAILYFALGALYKRTGRLEEAQTRLRDGLAIVESAPAYTVLGDVAWQLGEESEARQAFARAVELEPDNDEAWYGVGLTAADASAALAAFSRAVAFCATNATAHRELGRTQWKLGDLKAAEQSLRRAIELNPDDAWSHNYLGQILLRREHDEAAYTELRQAVTLWPEVPLFHCNLGDALAKLSRLDDAEECYKAALGLDISYYLANLRYAQLLERRRRPQRAIVYAQRALAAAPDDHRAQELVRRLSDSPGG